MTNNIKFSSLLDIKYRDALEELLFFNPQQHKFISDIIDCIETFGQPLIVEDNGFLRIHVEGLPDVQYLYALECSSGDTNPIGVIIYNRIDSQNIVLMHIGVKEEYLSTGKYADKLVAITLINRLREVAKAIKGVKNILMMYGAGDIIKIRT